MTHRYGRGNESFQKVRDRAHGNSWECLHEGACVTSSAQHSLFALLARLAEWNDFDHQHPRHVCASQQYNPRTLLFCVGSVHFCFATFVTSIQ